MRYISDISDIPTDLLSLGLICNLTRPRLALRNGVMIKKNNPSVDENRHLYNRIDVVKISLTYCNVFLTRLVPRHAGRVVVVVKPSPAVKYQTEHSRELSPITSSGNQLVTFRPSASMENRRRAVIVTMKILELVNITMVSTIN